MDVSPRATIVLPSLVNGIVVMKDSGPLRRFDAGRPIRFEREAKGRFKPLSIENWTKTATLEGGDIADAARLSQAGPPFLRWRGKAMFWHDALGRSGFRHQW